MSEDQAWHASRFRAFVPMMCSSVSHLSDRFPDLSEQAARLYESDGAFRDLCEVHAICVRGVRRSEASGSSALRAEYAAQQIRLEEELLIWLQASRSGEARPPAGR